MHADLIVRKLMLHFHAPEHDAEPNELWLVALQLLYSLGGPWPMKAVMEFRPSAVSLKIWLSQTTVRLTNS